MSSLETILKFYEKVEYNKSPKNLILGGLIYEKLATQAKPSFTWFIIIQFNEL